MNKDGGAAGKKNVAAFQFACIADVPFYSFSFSEKGNFISKGRVS
jgi:hypothetical protein